LDQSLIDKFEDTKKELEEDNENLNMENKNLKEKLK
jgi:regulator of replication initiation timing